MTPASHLLARPLFALGIVIAGAFAAPGARAQADNPDKWTLKPLVPPVFIIPQNSQLNPGTVGGNPTPYTTAPLQNPAQSTQQSTPGLKLSIPTQER